MKRLCPTDDRERVTLRLRCLAFAASTLAATSGANILPDPVFELCAENVVVILDDSNAHVEGDYVFKYQGDDFNVPRGTSRHLGTSDDYTHLGTNLEEVAPFFRSPTTFYFPVYVTTLYPPSRAIYARIGMEATIRRGASVEKLFARPLSDQQLDGNARLLLPAPTGARSAWFVICATTNRPLGDMTIHLSYTQPHIFTGHQRSFVYVPFLPSNAASHAGDYRISIGTTPGVALETMTSQTYAPDRDGKWLHFTAVNEEPIVVKLRPNDEANRADHR